MTTKNGRLVGVVRDSGDRGRRYRRGMGSVGVAKDGVMMNQRMLRELHSEMKLKLQTNKEQLARYEDEWQHLRQTDTTLFEQSIMRQELLGKIALYESLGANLSDKREEYK